MCYHDLTLTVFFYSISVPFDSTCISVVQCETQWNQRFQYRTIGFIVDFFFPTFDLLLIYFVAIRRMDLVLVKSSSKSVRKCQKLISIVDRTDLERWIGLWTDCWRLFRNSDWSFMLVSTNDTTSVHTWTSVNINEWKKKTDDINVNCTNFRIGFNSIPYKNTSQPVTGIYRCDVNQSKTSLRVRNSSQWQKNVLSNNL